MSPCNANVRFFGTQISFTLSSSFGLISAGIALQHLDEPTFGAGELLRENVPFQEKFSKSLFQGFCGVMDRESALSLGGWCEHRLIHTKDF